MNFSSPQELVGRRISTMLNGRLRARHGERGATAVEYGLMVGLIAVVIIGAVTLFGRGVDALFVIPAGVFGG
jgi:pilus assembly protein Flp/PilA